MLLSIILTASVLYLQIGGETIIAILATGDITAVTIYLLAPAGSRVAPPDQSLRASWRMHPLAELPPRPLTTLNKLWLLVLRAYLVVAAGLALVRILTLATTGG